MRPSEGYELLQEVFQTRSVNVALVCADWMEDYGDSDLARFVKLWMLIESSPGLPQALIDPAMGCQSHNTRRAILRKMVHEHGDRWLEVFPNVNLLFAGNRTVLQVAKQEAEDKARQQGKSNDTRSPRP